MDRIFDTLPSCDFAESVLQVGSERTPFPSNALALETEAKSLGHHPAAAFRQSKEMQMKQHFISAVGVMVALTGLSALCAADPGSPSGGERFQPGSETRPAYTLSLEQMDKISAGRWNVCAEGPDICPGKPPIDYGGAGCPQCPVIWNNGIDGPIIIWDRSGG
jgi:hypothetical protein